MLVRFRSGSEPIPVLSTGKEDSLESRIARFFKDLIKPAEYANLPDNIEKVLDEEIEQPESFSLSEFEDKLKVALESVMQTTIQDAVSKYDIKGLTELKMVIHL